jgi:amino acid adenylation domain-containing protein
MSNRLKTKKSRTVRPADSGAVKFKGGGSTKPRAAGRRPAAENVCVHQLFEWQAEHAPDAVAVTQGECVLSYGELNARANRLADQLRAIGVGPETVAGLVFRRSIGMLTGAIAILKAGGAYLPIDSADSVVRSGLILNDAGASVVVTEPSSDFKAQETARQTIVLDEFGQAPTPPVRARLAVPTASAGLKNLAYVIYTSGSTGTPKGVEIAHDNLSNLVAWHQRAFGVTARDRASCVAKVGFDAGVWEIWPYLAAGASLHMPEEEKLNNPEALQAWLISHEITIGFVPTPLAERLLSLCWPERIRLRMMLTGGDALHCRPSRDLPFQLVNNYGPTECTVVATSGLVSEKRVGNELPPIGRPVANTQVYILDESLNRVPAGTPGEIYIGGMGVARGYRNQSALTAEKFVPDPFAESDARLFRTGDLGRYLADGQIAFLGRRDEQVKIRGFRIEPNEIVTVLNQHPAICQSAVVAREISPQEKSLVAYLVSSPERQPALKELRDFVGARLPGYMVPATFVSVEFLPLTPNGKVDRAALPPPDAANTFRDAGFTGPRTEVETLVAEVLAPLLGVEQVDVEANFFSLGGHSLLGSQLISRLRSCLGVEIPLRTVFEAPSVANLSAEIEQLLHARLASMSEAEVQQTLNRSEH